MKLSVNVPQVIVRETRLKNKDSSFAKEQVVLLMVEGRLAPLETAVLLQQGAQPFEPGSYEVNGTSFGVGNYGRVEFRLRLGARIDVPSRKVA